MACTESPNIACPWCGGDVPVGRRFCRPSCRVRFEHAQRAARAGSLFDQAPAPLTMVSEFDDDDDTPARPRTARKGTTR